VGGALNHCFAIAASHLKDFCVNQKPKPETLQDAEHDAWLSIQEGRTDKKPIYEIAENPPK
jgi:hypothetical protein